jgi:hypothetical protein
MNQFILTTPEQLSEIVGNALTNAMKGIHPEKSENNGEILLSRKETAEKIKISLVTLNDYTKRGLLKSYIIGGRVLYKSKEVEASLGEVKTVKY